MPSDSRTGLRETVILSAVCGANSSISLVVVSNIHKEVLRKEDLYNLDKLFPVMFLFSPKIPARNFVIYTDISFPLWSSSHFLLPLSISVRKEAYIHTCNEEVVFETRLNCGNVKHCITQPKGGLYYVLGRLQGYLFRRDCLRQYKNSIECKEWLLQDTNKQN